MKKKEDSIPGHDEGARLTPEEAAAMVRSQWAANPLYDDASIGDFLLLLRSICYTKELDEREEIMNAIENVLLPYLPGIDATLNTIMRERLTVAHSLVNDGGTQ
jgi:hypothetical protein